MDLLGTLDSVFKMRHITEHVFFRSFFSRITDADGMGHSQIITLIILKIHGPMRMSYVSEKLNMEKGSFTPVAKRLYEMGYIEKCRDEKDKRSFILALTEEGEKLAQKTMDDHLVYIQNLIDIFDDEERDRFFNAIHDVMVLSKKIEESMK